jgi:hypothetical protein
MLLHLSQIAEAEHDVQGDDLQELPLPATAQSYTRNLSGGSPPTAVSFRRLERRRIHDFARKQFFGLAYPQSIGSVGSRVFGTASGNAAQKHKEGRMTGPQRNSNRPVIQAGVLFVAGLGSGAPA